MAKQQKITTAATMGPEHLPEGTRPEEFLRDADLVGYYERQLAGMKEGDPNAADVKRLLRSARIGAASAE